MNFELGHKFTIAVKSSLKGELRYIKNESGQEVAFIKPSKELCMGMQIFSDRKYTELILAEQNGIISGINEEKIANMHCEEFASVTPLTFTFSDGTTAEVRTNSPRLPYFKNRNLQLTTIKFELFSNGVLQAHYNLTTTKLICEIEKNTSLSNTVLLAVGAVLFLGYPVKMDGALGKVLAVGSVAFSILLILLFILKACKANETLEMLNK